MSNRTPRSVGPDPEDREPREPNGWQHAVVREIIAVCSGPITVWAKFLALFVALVIAATSVGLPLGM